MTDQACDNNQILMELAKLFGTYRAEWNKEDIFSHFTKPSYFGELEQLHPCVLQGGRGSGKTTALKGLSYQGQYHFRESSISRFDNEVPYVGLYMRIDTNHVRAFVGGGVSEETWRKFFGHYFNIAVVKEIALFLNWHDRLSRSECRLSEEDMIKTLRLLGVPADKCQDYDNFSAYIEDAMFDFQEDVNNISASSAQSRRLTMIGTPINFLIERVCSLRQFSKKHFFIVLDEYENLEDYQQVIINTLIKHSAGQFSFKIGVRELGWRTKHTLNHDEMLNDPADYTLLDIWHRLDSNNRFHAFAREVCQRRFEKLSMKIYNFNVEDAFEDLSMEEEAERLGVCETELLKKIDGLKLKQEVKELVSNLPSLYRFTIGFWAETHNTPIEDEIAYYCAHKEAWDERYDNYKYHMLFKINTGRGSSRYQKLYCGFDTYVKLASNNIRYLMELVFKAFTEHLLRGNNFQSKISAELQTDIAKQIGSKNLAQLEGVCSEGSKIIRMLLGLGRLFEMKAKAWEAGAPEVDQFQIDGLEQDGDLERLIIAAVHNLALERMPDNKRAGYETRAYSYNIHPIFSPFFVISCRRKRKMTLSLQHFNLLRSDPEKFLREEAKNPHSPDDKPENVTVAQMELRI